MRAPPDLVGPQLERVNPILRCALGELPANVALMQAAIEAEDAGSVERALRDAHDRFVRQGTLLEASRIGRALDLWNGTPGAFAAVKAIAGIADHRARATDTEQHIARWARAFDAAADISPEASVALYSLGAPHVLDAITAEVIGRMREWGLLSVDSSILEIGCGIGRFARALGPVRSYLGVDISGRMVEKARATCGELANVTFLRRSGHDLGVFPSASIDLVMAVDALPYLVCGGDDLAAACLREAARVLTDKGRILVLNWSYRDDADADRADLRRLADPLGLTVIRNGTSDFSLWDGLTFLLERRRGNAPRA
jgi:SAM-dependent methyltransferase